MKARRWLLVLSIQCFSSFVVNLFLFPEIELFNLIAFPGLVFLLCYFVVPYPANVTVKRYPSGHPVHRAAYLGVGVPVMIFSLFWGALTNPSWVFLPYLLFHSGLSLVLMFCFAPVMCNQK